MGQTEKNSARANVFQVTPESGHCATQPACLKGPTAVVKKFASDDELYASGTDPLFFVPITNQVAILPFPLTSIGPRLSHSNLSLTRSYVSAET